MLTCDRIICSDSFCAFDSNDMEMRCVIISADYSEIFYARVEIIIIFKSGAKTPNAVVFVHFLSLSH